MSPTAKLQTNQSSSSATANVAAAILVVVVVVVAAAAAAVAVVVVLIVNVVLMGSDFASRLRAKFKRRHSATTSIESNRSGAETSSLKSQHGERDQLSLKAPSQTGASSPQEPGRHSAADNDADDECSPRQELPRDSDNANGEISKSSNHNSHNHNSNNNINNRRPASSPATGGSGPISGSGSGASSSAPAVVCSPVASAGLQLQQQQNLKSRRLQSLAPKDTPGNDLHPHSTQPHPQPQHHQPYPPQPSPALSLPLPPRNLDSIHEDLVADKLPPLSALAEPAAGHDLDPLSPNTAALTPASFARPPGPPRRQSLLSTRQTTLINTLLHSPTPNDAEGNAPVLPINAEMVTRKIWVKRPNASATLVTVNEDDLVDDVRDLILRKYANSLGRTFDSPDLTIHICPRDQHKERALGPEEPVGRTLDAYFPGGQTVEEALIIDIPRRGPKASPRPGGPFAATTVYYTEDGRPSEAGEGYFPPVGGVPSPHLPVSLPAQTNGAGNPPSIAVLGTGHIAPIPSPGGTRPRSYRERPDRPRLGRTHTSSPTIIGNGPPGSGTAPTTHGMQPFQLRKPRSRAHSNSSADPAGMPPAPPIPTPPAPEASQARVATPPPRISSPRASNRPKKTKKNVEHLNLPPGMLNGTVPPISVLIVEDNPINLKLLEAFVKRLKVRWQTAMNGRDAVSKWRTGGFHLVLMDIQLPVMNGLDATREIRRLERVNSIGVFSQAPGNLLDDSNGELNEQDRLGNLALFKSPVIIVALTASSLQSDRHEALAAGCNDFLTKVCST